jgi:hypothetical protein
MRHLKRWKLNAPASRTDLVQTELLRDIRALLYILALDATNYRAHNRLSKLEEERMEEDPDDPRKGPSGV